jgi:hypothetical protein
MVYEKVSEFNSKQIVEMARKFFKKRGLELEESSDTQLDFKGEGGFVIIRCKGRGRDNTIGVELETKEWGKPVKKFMRKI